VPPTRNVTLTATDVAVPDPDGPEGPLVGDPAESATSAPQPVTIANSAPPASFTGAANTQLGQALAVAGPAPAADPDGIQSWAWDLNNDGSFADASGQTLALNFAEPAAAPGLKSVALRVTDACGVETTSPTTFFNVANPPPVASFTVTPTGSVGASAVQAGESVTITSTSTDQTGGEITQYQWDLNGNGVYNEGGATGEANAASVTTSFGAGTAAIRLVVTDEHGASDDHVDFVGVSALPLPKAGFTFSPADPLPGQRVTLTSTSTISTAAGAPPLDRIEWDFDHAGAGDFTPDAGGAAVTTSFATPGAKTVAVRATDTAGGFSTVSGQIVVNAAPQASFTAAPSKPVEGSEVTFASTSSDPDGPLVKQEWDLDGDNQFDDAQGAVASTRKLRKGDRQIRLRVTDSKGATAISNKVIVVKGKPLKPPVDVESRVSYFPRQWGIVLNTFTVAVPSRTKVAVTCRGGGCPKGTYRKSSKSKKALLRFPKVERSLRAGARISIVFTRPGYMVGWDTITIRGNKRRTVLREGCRPPGAKKQKKCPGG
jgi:hypothetical protein